MKLKNKGSIQDIIFAIVGIFAFIIIVLVMSPIADELFQEMNETAIDHNVSEQTKNIMTKDTGDSYISLFDGLALVIMVGLSVAVLIFAFMINTHPAFYFISLFVLGFIVVIGAMLSNVYEDIATHDEVSEQADKFIISSFLMSQFPKIAIGLSILIVVVMFAKGRLLGE